MQQIEISDLQNQIGVLLKAINQGEEVVFIKVMLPVAKVVNLTPGKIVAKLGAPQGKSSWLPILMRQCH